MDLKIFTLYENQQNLFHRIPMSKQPKITKMVRVLNWKSMTLFILFLCFIFLLVIGILEGDTDLIRLESSSL